VVAAAVTTSEAMPPYDVFTSLDKRVVDTAVIVDQHPQPEPHPYPRPPVALNNVSYDAVLGRLPAPPTGVKAVRLTDGTVVIRWTPPGDRVDYYIVQYRTVGGWLPLANHLDADTTSFVWTTASRGVVYRFRLLSVSRYSGNSLPSDVATLHVDGLEFLSLPVLCYKNRCFEPACIGLKKRTNFEMV